MGRVAVVDFELAGVEGFDLGIERAHAGNPWQKRRPSLAVDPACTFHDRLWERLQPQALALQEEEPKARGLSRSRTGNPGTGAGPASRDRAARGSARWSRRRSRRSRTVDRKSTGRTPVTIAPL